MPFKLEHSARLQNPKKFKPESFRRNDSPVFGKKLPAGVEVVWAKTKGRSAPTDPIIPQAIRFPDDTYTETEAKKWLDDNGIKYILFEPSEKTKESILEEIKDIGTYHASGQSDKVLTDDLKLVTSWYTTLKTKGKFKYDEDQILHLAAGIVKEILRRGKLEFHPDIWQDQPKELYSKIFKGLYSQGVEIPNNVKMFLDLKEDIQIDSPSRGFSESKHRKDLCMCCNKTPEYVVLWAEGHGRAWFCELCLKEWATIGDGRGDINSVKNIKDGKVLPTWADNTNPNIWEKLKINWIVESKKELKGKVTNFILRCKKDNENKNDIYEILIESGKDVLDRLIFSCNFLEQNNVEVLRKTMNIQTPNGEPFSEWMDWEGSIPAKDSILKEVTVIEETEDGIYKVEDKQGNEITTQKTIAAFCEGDKAWIDQLNNLYTGDKGGAAYGNLNESIPVFIKIEDSGDVKIIEETDLFTSFKFSGKKLKGCWIAKKENIKSDLWIFRKDKLLEEKLNATIVVRNYNYSSSTGFSDSFTISVSTTEPTDFKFNESKYRLIPTKNGKLILNKV